MSQEEFSVRFSNSPIKRAKLEGLQRNACVALGNTGDRTVVKTLGIALRNSSSIVRSHAAWALGQLKGKQAIKILEDSLIEETDGKVLKEIKEALIS